jgi:hypothetical protein
VNKLQTPNFKLQGSAKFQAPSFLRRQKHYGGQARETPNNKHQCEFETLQAALVFSSLEFGVWSFL